MPDEHTLDPWIDFRYGSNYASDFGLLRTSDGKRYNDNLIPTLNDKTAEVPGGDGTYYFNSYYKQKQFNINFAYDHLTETQLRAVKNWLNGKEIKELEFDERPGRIYFAKVTGSPSFKYLPFETYEHDSNNVYASNFQLLTQLSSSAMLNWPTQETYYNVNGYYIHNGKASKIGSVIVRKKGTGDTTYQVRVCPNPDQPLSDRTGTSQFAWNESGVRTEPKYIEFYLPFDSPLRGIFSEFGTFTDTEPEPFTPELIYKGEGSVTFTCYDPYAYSAEISATINSSSAILVGGDLNTVFTISITDTVAANTTISLKDGNTTIGELQIKETASNLIWNGKTGLVQGTVSNETRPVKFAGNSMVTIPPTALLKLTNASGTLTYHQRFY